MRSSLGKVTALSCLSAALYRDLVPKISAPFPRSVPNDPCLPVRLWYWFYDPPSRLVEIPPTRSPADRTELCHSIKNWLQPYNIVTIVLMDETFKWMCMQLWIKSTIICYELHLLNHDEFIQREYFDFNK